MVGAHHRDLTKQRKQRRAQSGTVVRSTPGLRALQAVDADGAAATARLVHDGQARRAMLVEFTARFFDWLIRATTRRRGTHDRSDAYLRSAPVISRHATTHVALGDDTDQLESIWSLNHRRTAAARIAHRSRSVCRRVVRRTARRRFDWFHHITTTTHCLCLIKRVWPRAVYLSFSADGCLAFEHGYTCWSSDDGREGMKHLEDLVFHHADVAPADDETSL